MLDDQPQEFIAPSLEELNELIPGYDFIDFLAKGGMGAVYLCRQVSLDRLVAIKVLPPMLCKNVSFKESFETEAKLMAKLNHVNLIGIYDFGDIDGMLYIVMEYVEGNSLHDSASGKMIEQEAVVGIISGICGGLEHAHDAGMLHRDVKPANILLDVNALAKIGDFGLARPSDMTETGTIWGTPNYTAPEVLGAPEKVDQRTDIYAVGVILYELLTGELPSVPYISVADVAETDARFDSIIKRAINHDIELRYATVNELSVAINEVIKKPDSGSKLRAGLIVETGSTRVNVSSAMSTSRLQPSSVDTAAMQSFTSTNLDSKSSNSPKFLAVLLGLVALVGGVCYVFDVGSTGGVKIDEDLAPIDEAGPAEKEKNKKEKNKKEKNKKERIARDAIAKREKVELARIAREAKAGLEKVELGKVTEVNDFTMKDLADLKAKAKEAVDAQQKEIEKKHVPNLKKLKLGLNAFRQNFLDEKEQSKARNISKVLNELASRTRVKSNVKGSLNSSKAKSLVQKALDVQFAIRDEDAKTMIKIRDAYELQLTKLSEEMSKLGQKNKVSILKREIKSIGKTNKDFESYVK